MTIKLLLLKNESDVGYADKSVKRWDACIPSNHALAAMCANKGIKYVYHAELVPEEHYQDYTKQVANTLKILSNCFCSDCPKDLKNIIENNLLEGRIFLGPIQSKYSKDLNHYCKNDVIFFSFASKSKLAKDCI